MKYKALLMDIDGTLVKVGSLEVSSTVREAVTKASKLLHIGIATTRMLYRVPESITTLPFNGPSVIGSGAIVEFPSKRILFEKEVDEKDVAKVLTIVKKYPVTPSLRNNTSEVKNFRTTKVTGIKFLHVPDKYLEPMHKELSQIPTISLHRSADPIPHTTTLDVMHTSISKQTGIQRVAKILNISTQEIIGIGDHYNDFPLLMECGLKVAMGNAVDDLKAIANYIAPNVDNDGVADVINKFILNHD